MDFHQLLDLYLRILEDVHIHVSPKIRQHAQYIPHKITEEIEKHPNKIRIIKQYIRYYNKQSPLDSIELPTLRDWLDTSNRRPRM